MPSQHPNVGQVFRPAEQPHRHTARTAFVLTALLLAVPALALRSATPRPNHDHPAWPTGETVRYRLRMIEDRDTLEVRTQQTSELRLKLDMTLAIKPGKQATDEKPQELECTIEHLLLTGRLDRQNFHFDSTYDQEDKQNPVAGLLSNLHDATFIIDVGANGRFQQVRNLDQLWASRGLMFPTPGLMSIQMLFRDYTMFQLLEPLLSPPLPATTAEPGQTYKDFLQVNIPLVAMLEWPAEFTVRQPTDTDAGPLDHITATGTIVAIRPIRDIATAGLLYDVVDGKRTADIKMDPKQRQVVQQDVEQNVRLDIRLQPPDGGTTQRREIQQKLTIKLERLPKQ
jgi:hypothetical protein